jgi:hypothetical protein
VKNASSTSIKRIGYFFLHSVLTLALLGKFGVKLLPDRIAKTASALHTALDMLQFTFLPGLFISFILLVLFGIRSIKQSDARLRALMYFLVFVLLSGFTMQINHTPTPAPEGPETALQAQNESDDNEDFIAGTEWAGINKITTNRQCIGAQEFVRGCRIRIGKNRIDLQNEGIAWAKQNRPTKASFCTGLPNFELGCRRYYFEFLEVKKLASQNKYEGMTTAECKTEVNANYALSERLDMENGNDRSIEVTRRRSWDPELQDCENFDKAVYNKFMPEAYLRLQTWLDMVRKGQGISLKDKDVLIKDFHAMYAIVDQPYRTAYFDLYRDYRSFVMPKASMTIPELSCNTIKEKLQAIEAQASIDTEIRENMLWEWKLLKDKLLSCR